MRIAKSYAKEYGPAVTADALMYAGIHQVISASSQLIAIGIIQVISGIGRRVFRDVTLPEWGEIPWGFYIKVCAIGIIVIVVGILVGLWANSRSGHQSLESHREEV